MAVSDRSEAIVKLAGAYILHLSKDVIKNKCTEMQFAFTPLGTEIIAHKVRDTLRDPSTVCITIDFHNAFNSIHRKAIAEALYKEHELKRLWPMFRLLYCVPSELLLSSGKTIASSSGVRQGDILGPSFFCLGLASILRN
jgi:hypothetical protein